jgi:hypothetical protein
VGEYALEALRLVLDQADGAGEGRGVTAGESLDQTVGRHR